MQTSPQYETSTSNLLTGSQQLVVNRLKNISFKTTRIRIPGFNFSLTPVDFPNRVLYVPGSKFHADPVVASFIVDETLENYFEAVKWMVRCRTAAENELLDELEDFTVNLLDNQERSSVSFRYTKGFVSAVDGFDIDSSQNPAVPLVCSLTIYYQGVEIDQYKGGDAETVLGLTI